MAATSAPAPVAEKPTETKAERFVRLANARTMKALDAIAAIGGLASKANYEYSEEQVSKVLGTLADEMRKLEARFKNPEAKEGRASIL